MLCGGNLYPHFPKKWDCEKMNQNKTIDLQNSEKNVDFDSSKSSEYATTDTPTSTESSVKNENILLQHSDEIHTARTFATFFSCVGHKLFYVLSIVRM